MNYTADGMWRLYLVIDAELGTRDLDGNGFLGDICIVVTMIEVF
jgi:hypothetical protein